MFSGTKAAEIRRKKGAVSVHVGFLTRTTSPEVDVLQSEFDLAHSLHSWGNRGKYNPTMHSGEFSHSRETPQIQE